MGETAKKQHETPISDTTLRGFLGYHMKRAFNVLQADLNRALKPFGLRMVTYSALVTIVENPGLRQAQLADVLAIERPNLVVIIDELEKAGLITREPAPNDRRAYALMPTSEGKRVAMAATEANRAGEARRLKGLDEVARQQVIEVMRQIEKS